MRHRFYSIRLLSSFFVVLSSVTAVVAETADTAPDPARIEQLSKMLREKPRGVGPTIEDRKAWDAVTKAGKFKGVIGRAEKLLKQPMPELTDEIYLDYSKTGSRTRYLRVLGQRHRRMADLVIAECIENRGRFLPAIEETIKAICSEKTWIYSFHDRKNRNFKGEVVEVDLLTACLAWNMATADYWLGDKLSPKIRRLIRDNLERRVFKPFESIVTTGKPRTWWLTHPTNNWNAVCLAGVTGSALAIIESPERRAFFLASAEKNIQNFLSGFTSDGYCTEGIGYWNYGFGNYVMLAETVYQATDDRLDMFQDPRVRQIAMFGPRMEIAPGVYPAFADCSCGARPAGWLTAFLSRRFELGLKGIEERALLLNVGPSSHLFRLGVFGFQNSATKKASAEQQVHGRLLRDWFPAGGVLICRPEAGKQRALAVALKGGHNAEQHNHNDVGSFVVVLGGKALLVDPGSETYTRRTFSPQRYESEVINSFGHGVPRIAGKLQKKGRAAAAKVLKTQFTDKADTLVLDISSAYDVKELKQLKRTFVFSREGQGSLTVIDQAEFDTPQSFGAALITFSKWKQISPNSLLVGEGEDAVQVDIACDGGDVQIEDVQIKDGRKPTRLGINMTEPVEKATIRVTITPAKS